jgi:hypothetical protein
MEAWREVVFEGIVEMVGDLLTSEEVFTREVGYNLEKEFGEEENAVHREEVVFWGSWKN